MAFTLYSMMPTRPTRMTIRKSSRIARIRYALSPSIRAFFDIFFRFGIVRLTCFVA